MTIDSDVYQRQKNYSIRSLNTLLLIMLIIIFNFLLHYSLSTKFRMHNMKNEKFSLLKPENCMLN